MEQYTKEELDQRGGRLMAKNNIITVRFLDGLAAALDARSESRAEAIRRSLERYYDLLRRTRVNLADRFSAGECGAILDANNGSIFETWSIRLVAANVEDSEPDGLYEKWGINGPALVDKLQSLSLVEAHALVDAIERWWRDDQRKDPSTLLD